MTEHPETPEADMPEPQEAAGETPDEDKQAKAARLETELRQVRSELIAGAKAVLRVLPPHSAFTWAGITVTDEPTTVPVSAVPGLQEAAANAKPPVNLTQEA